MKSYRARILILAAGIALSIAAWGHAVIDEGTVTPGRQFITVRITHGCGISATHTVRIQMPAGITRVYPFYVPGWTVKTKLRKLDQPFKGEDGVMVTDTVDQVDWTGGPIPDGLFAEFKFKVDIPSEPGRTLYFKTVQLCEKGEVRWIETPKPGEKDFNYSEPGNSILKHKEPAPFTKIVAGPASPH